MGFNSLLVPSRVVRRPSSGSPDPRPSTHDVVDRASWSWEGRIVARTWPAGFTEDEYRLMLVGGRKHRLARPDGWGAAGQPVFILTDYERRMRDRLLARGDTVCETHNVACNGGRTVVLNLIAGTGGFSGVNYFAIGTGLNVTPLATDTQLGSEQFRKQLTTTTVNGNQVDLSTNFATSEGNFSYSEAGLFGNGATGTANSGSLFAHALYTYSKTSSVVLTNEYFIILN